MKKQYQSIWLIAAFILVVIISIGLVLPAVISSNYLPASVIATFVCGIIAMIISLFVGMCYQLRK